MASLHFIPPCIPVTAKSVPTGDGWLHEVKFDGYRVQAHKVGSRVVIYSRNGHDFTDRFPSIAQLLHELPAKAAVLDGEVVASDADGRPNFRQAACALEPAGHNSAIDVRLARSQRSGLAPAASDEAPGAPAGPVGALRQPGHLTIRNLRRRPGAAARS